MRPRAAELLAWLETDRAVSAAIGGAQASPPPGPPPLPLVGSAGFSEMLDGLIQRRQHLAPDEIQRLTDHCPDFRPYGALVGFLVDAEKYHAVSRTEAMRAWARARLRALLGGLRHDAKWEVARVAVELDRTALSLQAVHTLLYQNGR